ncbi:oligopeptidase B [Corynebacterium yudongzhengii]|uniref:S9 family peptidase n=1 Tax=Corynebacterium yudongzhengii TaxID=2080740 RepID=A0A2U1T5R8_9CORY|nr:S9 family peptidase [Corynebacterium yudongzhengii]AWB82598.1 oligopeptidase B [Corynebacterium yudongzhengii]PWC01332.1 S9 family peptidase [Corynebacterium yudongzhengii]
MQFSAQSDNGSTNAPQAPRAAKKPQFRVRHGREIVDNYEWLRDKESPDTLAYLEAENAYTKQKTAHLDTLRENIFEEIRSRVKETDMSVPTRAGDWWYYARISEGKSYGYSCRVPVDKQDDSWVPPTIPDDGPADGEQVLLDLDTLAEGHDFFTLGASSVTTSGCYLAYSVDTTGDERFDLFVKDLETGKLLDDRLTGIFYGATWAGEDYLFYSRVDDAWRPDSVWRHKIGTPESEDVLVYREEDERFNVGIGGTRSERYLFIESGSKITTEVRMLKTDDPTGDYELLWERESGVEYTVDEVLIDGEWRLIVTHNATGPNFAISECAIDNRPPLRELTDLVAHDDEVRIEGVDTFSSHIVLSYRRGGIGRVALMRLPEHGYGTFEEIEFDEELFTAGAGANAEWEAPVLRMGYTSFTTPATVLDYDLATGEKTILKQQEIPNGYRREDYTSYRIWTTASDGTEIPVSVVHRADLDTTTPNPTLLYGYGSYEASMDPGFSVSRLSLLDRGMVFVIAHVRGGGEMGRNWYDDGKMLRKKNTFTDFIAVADDLVARGLTTPDQLVAEGGSAGGMLIGAVANMAPEKFAGLLAVVPFVDALTSMLMPELPLTVPEWDEWGDPYHDPEVYDYMASYAAYDNVVAQDYPDILAVTSLNDTRVLYVEPAKWLAKLREFATGGEILLQTEMSAGHGGVSGRYDKWRQTAFEYAWLVHKATGLSS